MVLLRIREAAGPVAHLVERLICTEEAGGSNPLGSTKSKHTCHMTGVFCMGLELILSHSRLKF